MQSDIQIPETETRQYFWTLIYKNISYIRPVQTKSATFGKWPGQSYCHSWKADTLSFPKIYYTLTKCKI